MAQVTIGFDEVPNALFQDLCFRKTAFGFSIPDNSIAHANDEFSGAVVIRSQRDLLDSFAEGFQQFLGVPGGPQHPAAFRTEPYLNAMFH